MVEMLQTNLFGFSFGLRVIYFLRKKKVGPDLPRSVWYRLKYQKGLSGSTTRARVCNVQIPLTSPEQEEYRLLTSSGS